MTKNVFRGSIKFFLYLHYVVFLYFLVFYLGVLLYNYLGLWIAWLYTVFALYIPVGPLPIGIYAFYAVWSLPSIYALNSLWRILIAGPGIIVLIILKYLLTKALRNTKLLNIEAPKIILGYHVAIAVLVVLNQVFYQGIAVNTWTPLILAFYTLLITLPIDTSVLSYTKYRDTLRGEASPKWILALPILWLAVTWLQLTQVESWTQQPIQYTLVTIAIWATITILEIVIHRIYYRVITKNTSIPFTGL